jgi:hypothetical protein
MQHNISVLNNANRKIEQDVPFALYYSILQAEKKHQKWVRFEDIRFSMSKTHKNTDMYFTYLNFTLSCKQALIVANMQHGGYITHTSDEELL